MIKNKFTKMLDAYSDAINRVDVDATEQSYKEFAEQLETDFKKHLTEQNKKIKKNMKLLDSKINNYPSVAEDGYNGDEYLKLTKQLKKAQDSYNNSMMLIGTSDTMSQYDEYSIYTLLYNWYLWTAMYASSWVFARAIDKPAIDMVAPGWKLNIKHKDSIKISSEKVDDKIVIKSVENNHDVYEEFYDIQQSFITDLIQAQKLSRLYGGSVCGLIDNKTPVSDYEKPLTHIDPDATLRLIVADRWQNVMPSPTMVTDVGSPDWNTPEFYTLRTDSGDTYRLHHSRCLRFTNGSAPIMIQRMLMGWGIPLGVRLYNELTRDEKIKNMITSLLSKQSLEIIQTAGMRQYANGTLTPQMEKQLDAKLELINRYRNFNAILFLDKDDVYSRHESSTTGSLAQLVETNSRFVAGAIPMPQVLLYGDQQKGLSGNAVDDMRLYEDDLMNQRKEKLLNPAIKLSKWILMKLGVDYKSISIKFNSSISETVDEQVSKAEKLIGMYNQLISMKMYTLPMVVSEIKSRDDLLFGEALTDEVVQRINDEAEKSNKKGKNKAKGNTSSPDATEDLGEADIDFEDMPLGDLEGGGDIPPPTDMGGGVEDIAEPADFPDFDSIDIDMGGDE